MSLELIGHNTRISDVAFSEQRADSLALVEISALQIRAIPF